MGEAREPQLVKTFVGILTGRLSLLSTVNSLLQERLGPIDIESDLLEFNYTRYYENEMGPGLKRLFVGFDSLGPPDKLVEVKSFTNELERTFSEEGKRLVNLDPGYLTAAKVVLASTKDYAHRLYLGDGIYGEVTLVYQGGRFRTLPWTYPDYRSEMYHEFFRQLRTAYLAQIAAQGT
jgi:hypothetical protein